MGVGARHPQGWYHYYSFQHKQRQPSRRLPFSTRLKLERCIFSPNLAQQEGRSVLSQDLAQHEANLPVENDLTTDDPNDVGQKKLTEEVDNEEPPDVNPQYGSSQPAVSDDFLPEQNHHDLTYADESGPCIGQS